MYRLPALLLVLLLAVPAHAQRKQDDFRLYFAQRVRYNKLVLCRSFLIALR